METMRALRAEAKRYGVRPARSKAATIERIEAAARAKGVLTIRRMTAEALFILRKKMVERVISPSLWLGR